MTYQEIHSSLIAYLRAKVDQHDWHGVSDAANDLRVIEAEERTRSGQGMTATEMAQMILSKSKRE